MIGRRRGLQLLGAIVAIVAWMAMDAAGRSEAARSAQIRGSLGAAERIVMEAIQGGSRDWVRIDTAPARRPFERPADYEDALEAARGEVLWRASEEVQGRTVIAWVAGEPWLVVRVDDWVRARPWAPIQRTLATQAGVYVDLDGARPGLPLLPGMLQVGSEPVNAIVPAATRLLTPWLDVARALLAALLAGLLVWEVQRVEVARGREQALAEARDSVLQRISHELRTPAAAIRSLSDALSSGAVAGPDERRQFLDLIATEADRLALGIERLLRAARGHAPDRFDPVPIDLAEWTRAVAERWHSRLPNLRVEAPDQLSWRADPDRLDEAVDALLDNASKYGGETVALSVRTIASTVTLSVSDDGPGVAAADRHRIFERLQRVEGRPDDPGGYGLGLWAAAEVARAHGGGLLLEGDACFVLTLGDLE